MVGFERDVRSAALSRECRLISLKTNAWPLCVVDLLAGALMANIEAYLQKALSRNFPICFRCVQLYCMRRSDGMKMRCHHWWEAL
jgi:hypothetical protein